MSPHRTMSKASNRRGASIQDIFVGLAFILHDTAPSPDSLDRGGTRAPAPQPGESEADARTEAASSGKKGAEIQVKDLEYAMVLHDGTGVTESETFHFDLHVKEEDEGFTAKEAKRCAMDVLERIKQLEEERALNVRMVAVAEPVPKQIRAKKGVEFFSAIWLHVDAIPFLTTPATAMFSRLPSPSPPASATSAIQEGIKHLHPATHSATTADVDKKEHAVLVDCDEKVRLCSLTQYEQSTSNELWSRFIALAKHVRENNVSISFFSATPQGGGVALMRHALLRLYRMVGVKAKWYTPEGHPSIFDITKGKIHNVLQGVAKEGIEMTDEDKKWFEIWTEENFAAFWSDGAIDADVIVIDDPQLTALIPIIKKKRPQAKIIFRSHIQIQSDLTDDPSTPQYRTWNYLYDFVKDSDLFVAHPVKFFVPKNVHEGMPVVYMAPSTDPLDGLNKPYGHSSLIYYRQYFNQLAHQQCGRTMDWDRGYIIQVARFDPSKGIPILLEAYLKFRQALKDKGVERQDTQQLMIMGHGSVDDPDGTRIYEEIHDTLSTKEYAWIAEDVGVVRAPPSDSILGAMMQGAWVAVQLSTREGFEVKVTEAVNKRVPMIASDAGGIPLQVKEGVNGWVVPTGSSQAVADVLLDLHSGEKTIKRGSLSSSRALDGKTDPNSVAEAFVKNYDMPVVKVHDDEGATSEDFWTVGNATRWLVLFSRVLGLKVREDKGWEAEERGLLNQMKVEEKLQGKGLDGVNVWGLVMGEDMLKGEGEIREGKA